MIYRVKADKVMVLISVDGGEIDGKMTFVVQMIAFEIAPG